MSVEKKIRLKKHSEISGVLETEKYARVREWFDTNKPTYLRVEKLEDIAHLVDKFKSKKVFAFDTESNEDGIAGVSLCCSPGVAFYIPLQEDRYKKLVALTPLFQCNSLKIGHNIKWDIKELLKASITVSKPIFDTLIATWVIDSHRKLNKLGLKYLAQELLHIEMVGFSELFPKNFVFDFTRLPNKIQTDYACMDADMTFRLYQFILPRLVFKNIYKPKGTLSDILSIEHHLIPILANSELLGIKIDRDYYAERSKEAEIEVAELEKTVQKRAGWEVNLASPKQLSKLLFEQLELKPVRQTKTGYSTDVHTLNILANQNDIANLLLQHRKLAKLNSGFYKALLEKADLDGTIHTNLNQCGTETGRFSSSKPNLQQLPKGDKRVRRGIVARPKKILVAVDYSQIEYRLVASLSCDPYMRSMFEEGKDFHKQTASEIFNIPYEEVTEEQRRKAKTINFAIIYGMGNKKLASDLKISEGQAKEYLKKYFLARRGLEKWIKKMKYRIKSCKYSSTYFGRVRPFFSSKERPFYMERAGFNAIIQGTAADIMKMAILKVDMMLKKKKYDAAILLTVHDELVLEVGIKEDIKSLLRDLKEAMEFKQKGWVNIPVDIKLGKNWGDMEAVNVR